MQAQQQPIPYFYYTSPYSIPAYRTVSSSQIVLPDFNWRNSWPSVRSVIISITMLLFSAAVIALDIANVAIESNKQNGTSKLGSGTATVGTGIWCGAVSFIAAIFIIVIIFVQNKRIAATCALLSVILAFLFNIVLTGLAGNSVQNNQSKTPRTDAEKVQEKLLIAILSAALPIMITCIAFFAMYISVFYSSYKRQTNMR